VLPQSIGLECYYKDPDGKELLSNSSPAMTMRQNPLHRFDIRRDRVASTRIMVFSLSDFDLDKLFALRRPIVTLSIKTTTGKEYILELNNE
jgi:hypothetical protein